MPKFKKKPIIIEARQFAETKKSFAALRKWVGDGFYSSYQEAPFVFIHTLEGEMAVSPGDWVIKGVKGEFYPCKPEIFKETYERIVVDEKRAEIKQAIEILDDLIISLQNHNKGADIIEHKRTLMRIEAIKIVIKAII